MHGSMSTRFALDISSFPPQSLLLWQDPRQPVHLQKGLQALRPVLGGFKELCLMPHLFLFPKDLISETYLSECGICIFIWRERQKN